MNVWSFAFLLSTFIWSIFYSPSLLFIYLGILGLYTAFNFYYQRSAISTFRRKMQIATWNDAGDPSVFGRIEVDLTNIDAFLERFNQANPDNKLTYTVIFARALGQGLSTSNKLFGKICFGQFVPQPSVDLSVLVDVQGSNLANIVLEGCNLNSITSLNDQLRTLVREMKTGNNKELNEKMNIMRFVPSFVIQVILRLSTWITYDLGLPIPFLKMKKHNYGFGILTNVVAFNVHDATAPLVPFLKTVIVALMNTPRMRPVVVDGQVVVRKIMNFNITYDHRFGDGVDAVKMLRAVSEVFEDPDKFL